jgi:hypothetical protein
VGAGHTDAHGTLATAKIQKITLRQQFKDYRLPTSAAAE